MKVKLFEVRDVATFIPVAAFDCLPADTKERYLITQAGLLHEEFIFMVKLATGETHYDPNRWPSRTLKEAHKHVAADWRNLKSGAVIDVEYLLGETPKPKKSQRLTRIAKLRGALRRLRE